MTGFADEDGQVLPFLARHVLLFRQSRKEIANFVPFNCRLPTPPRLHLQLSQLIIHCFPQTNFHLERLAFVRTQMFEKT
jgi:hypothetical protein